MLERQYSEKLFIDRPLYTKQFREFLIKNHQGTGNEWIYYQYDAAEDKSEQGGIGKTFLLTEYINVIEKEFSHSFQVVKPIIDFIEIQNRTQITMWTTLAESLKSLPGADFSQFHTHIGAYFNTNELSYLHLAIDEFCQVCNIISSTLNKKLVFFFDTFELIQEQIERLERVILFPSDSLQNTTIIIINSRQKLNISSENWKHRLGSIKLLPIAGFTDEETFSFFERNKIELDGHRATIVNREYVKNLNASQFANGRPILLALAIDYIKNEVVDSNQIIKATLNFKEEFIDHLNKFRSPLDSIIRIMAHVYHPWDIEMIKKFKKFWLRESKISITPEKIFDQLRKLSFIRDAGENSIILHDEMRKLIIQYVWKKTDSDFGERQELSQEAISFYEELITKIVAELAKIKKYSPLYIQKRQEHRMYIAEICFHKLFSAFEKHFSNFLTNEFSLALEKGDLEQAELFLETLVELNNQRPFLETDWNRIELRQLRIYLGRYYFDEAEKLGLNLLYKLKTQLQDIKNGVCYVVSEYNKKNNVTEKNIFKAIGNVTHYLAQVCFRMADHKRADIFFNEANEYYSNAFSNEPLNFHTEFLLGRNLNWQGYVLMERGLFQQSIEYYTKAEQKLKHAISELHHHRKNLENDYASSDFVNSTEKRIKQWLAQVNGNRCRAFINIGEYNSAENFGFMALQMRRNLDLPVEIAKSLTSLGIVYQKQNKFDKALERFHEAQQILSEIREPLLLGRTLTNIGSTLMCRDAFSEIFFFSSIDSLGKAIERIENVFHPDHEKSIHNLTNAIDTLKTIHKPTADLANVLFNTGEYYLYHKEWQQAEKYLNEAREIALKVNNFYYYYDVLQRLLAIYYYSGLKVSLFQSMLTEIFEKSQKNGYTPIQEYPALLMRILLLKSNFLIDAYLKNIEFPIFDIQRNDALEHAFQGYYNTATLIYSISKFHYSKVVELMNVHQKKQIPVDEYNSLVNKILEWLENEKENIEFVEDFRIYFQ